MRSTADARAFRNRLIVISLISIVTSALLVILQWRLPAASIIEHPKGATGESAWALMLLVMAFGCVGALVSAIPAMAAIPRVKSPFNFPLQAALMKVFVGSLTALVGVIVTGSAGATNGYASLGALHRDRGRLRGVATGRYPVPGQAGGPDHRLRNPPCK